MSPATDALPKLGYSVREAAAVTSLGRTTLYKYLKTGRIRTTKIGGRTVIPADSLRRLIDGEG